MNSERKWSKKEGGIIIPKAEYLNKLFMRKSGLPVLKVHFQMHRTTLIGIPSTNK
jgi:hypothetical protein